MNMELLVYVGLAIFLVFCFVLNWRLIRDRYLKWLEADRRANELLRSVLSSEQYDQLTRKGFLAIKSPRDQARTYPVPREPGLVRVLEEGKQAGSLCLQPLEKVPNADMLVIHKLMLEADEETYLQTANRFAPLSTSLGDG
jgi:hypothetical protein